MDVRQDLGEIDKEIANPGAKQGALKRLAEKALTAFASAAATSGGQVLVQGLAKLVEMLTD